MTIDITAYKRLLKVENPILDENGEPVHSEFEWKPGESMKWSEKCFPGRGKGIDPDTVYTWEDECNFRAGNLCGYNWWINKLEEFSNGVSFMELINFDNEGVIGSIVSKKLLKDFVENETKAFKFSRKIQDGDWWLKQYKNWIIALKFASDNGAIEFH